MGAWAGRGRWATSEQGAPVACVVARVRGQQQEPPDHGEGQQPPRDTSRHHGGGQRVDEKQGEAG